MPALVNGGAHSMNGAAHPPNGTSEVGLDQVDEDDELLVMEEPNSPNVEEVFDRTKSLSVRERTYKAPPSSFSIPKQSMSDNGVNMAADFFSPEVFRIVLHNPTTAHRLLRFSQARMCGENMEFLEKVDRFNALLDEMMTVLTDIHDSYTSVDATRQIASPPALLKQLNADIKTCTNSTLLSMETLFTDTQQDVEGILRSSIYPRFVRYQLTNSATKALASDRHRYQGLGDCFCLTDPRKADNPIVLASDGFVAVTGYSRQEIVPRNCRFLQGAQTDRMATKRLRDAIDAQRETVELLLNYKKNGEPFWNLLYVAPLYDVDGNLAYYIGGQINCSTTIRSNTDVLRILSMGEQQQEEEEEARKQELKQKISKKSLFGHFRRVTNTSSKAPPRLPAQEPGMEQGLLNSIGKMNFRTQMEKFYTAYSKYVVVRSGSYNIDHFSQGLAETLGVKAENSKMLEGADVFKILAQHAVSLPRDFKSRVKRALKSGQAVSANIELITGTNLTKSRVDDGFSTHWTPCKDENGVTHRVVMTLSPVSF